jgi:hypothetical protein
MREHGKARDPLRIGAFVIMKAQNIRKTGLVLAAGVFALGAWMAQAQNNADSASPLPSGVADVLKLDQAKISDNTIIAYVQNSGNTYHLDTSQIIYLRDQGLSDGVITAMLSSQPGTTASAGNAQTPNGQTPDMNPPPPPDVNSAGDDTTTGNPPTVIYVNSTPVYYYPAWSYSWWWPVGVTWGWACWGGCWHWGCHNSFGFRPCGFWNHGFHGFSGFHGGFNHGFNSVHGFNNVRGFNNVHAVNGFRGVNGFQTVNGFHGMSSGSVVHFGGMSGGGFHGFNGSGMSGFHGMGGGGGMHFGGMSGGGGHFGGGGGFHGGGGGFGGGRGR